VGATIPMKERVVAIDSPPPKRGGGLQAACLSPRRGKGKALAGFGVDRLGEEGGRGARPSRKLHLRVGV